MPDIEHAVRRGVAHGLHIIIILSDDNRNAQRKQRRSRRRPLTHRLDQSSFPAVGPCSHIPLLVPAIISHAAGGRVVLRCVNVLNDSSGRRYFLQRIQDYVSLASLKGPSVLVFEASVPLFEFAYPVVGVNLHDQRVRFAELFVHASFERGELPVRIAAAFRDLS